MKVVIYNDTSRAFGQVHFGCQLVMETLHDLLEGAGYDVIGTIPLDDARRNKADKSLLMKADLVVANGEGSYHHNRRPDFAQLSKEFPTALINTVYQNNDDFLWNFKYIAARESASQMAVSEHVPCDLVPDVIFASKYLEGIQPSRGGGEAVVRHFSDVRTLQDKSGIIPVIAAADRVDTESFHGACVAAYYGKRVRIRPSNTHKMQGLAKDMGVPYGEYGYADEGYVPDAQRRIHAMIEKLRTL